MATATDDVLRSDATERVSAIELDWFAEGEVIRVIPRNQARFEAQKDRVIAMLQLEEYAKSQLNLLLERLGEWVNANSAKVEAAYLTVRDARFAFIAVSRATACDDDLEDSVSDLDLKIAIDPDLDVIHLNALILPPASEEAMQSFFDRRFLLVYSGNRI